VRRQSKSARLFAAQSDVAESGMSEKESPGIANARRLLKARKGPPTEAMVRPGSVPRHPFSTGRSTSSGHVHSRRDQIELDVEEHER
jgi:hypothetical protein